MVRFLDTNVLLRYLTKDDEEKAAASLALLQRAQRGEEKLVTSDLVVAELVWVLQSPQIYGLTRERIVDLLMPIISLRGLRIPSKGLFPRILEVYRDSQIDFIDAYNAALMERLKVNETYSYDQDFDRLDFVGRVEP